MFQSRVFIYILHNLFTNNKLKFMITNLIPIDRTNTNYPVFRPLKQIYHEYNVRSKIISSYKSIITAHSLNMYFPLLYIPPLRPACSKRVHIHMFSRAWIAGSPPSRQIMLAAQRPRRPFLLALRRKISRKHFMLHKAWSKYPIDISDIRDLFSQRYCAKSYRICFLSGNWSKWVTITHTIILPVRK